MQLQNGVHDLVAMFGLRLVSILAVAVMTVVAGRLDSSSETHGGIRNHPSQVRHQTEILITVCVKVLLKYI